MINYVGKQCPVCTKEFQEHDDIVVCPDCGSPYHRECYKTYGACMFKDRHNQNFDWREENITSEDRQNEENNDLIICTRCSHPNPKSALFCERCKFPLVKSHNNYETTENLRLLFDPFGSVNPEETFDDINAKDFASYIKGNSNYYLPIFKNMKYKKKGKFNLSAFVFGGIWLIFRKKYTLGSIIMGIILLLNFTLYFMNSKYIPEVIDEIMKATNINLNSALLSFDQSKTVSEYIFTMPWNKILIIMSPALILLTIFIIHLTLGFIANRIYMNYCIKKIKTIKLASLSEEEYLQKLSLYGGVNAQLASNIFLFLILLWTFGLIVI